MTTLVPTDLAGWPSAPCFPQHSAEVSGSSSQVSGDPAQSIKTAKIMIIDDEPLVIRVVRRFLQSVGYSKFIEINDSRKALESIRRELPDVVLLDIMMPHVDGLDILRARNSIHRCQFTPFIILSADSEARTKQEALQLGATEFLNKPVDPSELTLRVRNALLVKAHQDHLSNYAVELERKVRERTAELETSRELIIHCLAKAAEYRDNETGQHVIRVGKYASVIADQLGFGAQYCHQIELAAQLHDVGKMGVPDSILLSPGKLDKEEFEIMKRHCMLGGEIIEPLAEHEADRLRKHAQMGAEILETGESPILVLAARIARTHHEKWDGSGYPLGLRGEEIPIEGRITTVADVFDALTSERPYKQAIPVPRCFEIMADDNGTRFDPVVLQAFFDRTHEITEIERTYRDS